MRIYPDPRYQLTTGVKADFSIRMATTAASHSSPSKTKMGSPVSTAVRNRAIIAARLSHRRGCQVEFSCNFPLKLFSTSSADLSALLRARLSLLHPGDLAAELLAKGNGCLEETQSRH